MGACIVIGSESLERVERPGGGGIHSVLSTRDRVLRTTVNYVHASPQSAYMVHVHPKTH